MGARRNLFWKVVLILYLFYPVVRVIISIFVTSFNHSNYNPIDIIIKHIFVTSGNVPQWSTLSFPTWCARLQAMPDFEGKVKDVTYPRQGAGHKEQPRKKMFVWWKVDDPYWIPRKVLLATWRHQSVLWNHFHTRLILIPRAYRQQASIKKHLHTSIKKNLHNNHYSLNSNLTTIRTQLQPRISKLS